MRSRTACHWLSLLVRASRRGDQPFNRGYLPGSGLIASAEDLTHFLAAQLNAGRYGKASVLSAAGIAALHQPAVAAPGPHAECLTQVMDCAYAMGWSVRLINGVPAVIKSSDLPLFAGDVMLLPTARLGVVLLMNADTLLEPGRNHAIIEGVTSSVRRISPVFCSRAVSPRWSGRLCAACWRTPRSANPPHRALSSR